MEDEITGRDIVELLHRSRSLKEMRLAQAAMWTWCDKCKGTPREKEAFLDSGTMTYAKELYFQELEDSGQDSGEVWKRESIDNLKAVFYASDEPQAEIDEAWVEIEKIDAETEARLDALKSRVEKWLNTQRTL